LEGSVRKSGNNLRITAQLVEATEDVHLWAKKYSGTVDDVFDIQEKVSRSIVDALKVKLSPEADQRLSQKPIEDVRAYECYLRAQAEVMSFTEEGLERAQQLIRTGMEIAGESELLHAAMGNVYWQYVNIGFNPSQFENYIRNSEECARKALASNPDSAQAHYVLGMVHDMRGHLQEAVREHKKALRVDPDNPDALFWLALLYSIVGKGFASKPLAERLLEVDPLSAHNYLIPGWIALLGGNIEESLEPITKAYQMDPGSLLTRWGYAEVFLWNRQFHEAVPVVDSMIRDAPQNAFTLSAAFVMRALQGEKDEALQIVTPEFAEAARWDHSIAYMLAEGYAVLDEKELGLDWLETATSRGWINFPLLTEYDWAIDNLRGEERFKQIMKRVKSEWEHFEV
jgi:tetratricopeptide (TPR) repeat protein